MTYFYRTVTTSQRDGRIPEETRKLWEAITEKKNWRIVQLPNQYYQAEYLHDGNWKDETRRETIESCEAAIDASIEFYRRKLELAKGPVVVKTFE